MNFKQFQASHPINIESISRAQSTYEKFNQKILDAIGDISKDNWETVDDPCGKKFIVYLSTRYTVQYKLVRARGFDILGYTTLLDTDGKEQSKVYFNNAGEALDPEDNFEPIGKNINDDSHFLAVYLLKQAIPFQEG